MRAAAHLHEMLLVTTFLRLLYFLCWAITPSPPSLLFTRTAPAPLRPNTCLEEEVQLVQAAPRDTPSGVSTDKRGRPAPQPLDPAPQASCGPARRHAGVTDGGSSCDRHQVPRGASCPSCPGSPGSPARPCSATPSRSQQVTPRWTDRRGSLPHTPARRRQI
ncbi:uncharacterized protein LOC126999816 isoform X3 [Eriocheir sinensis]|uniref:uncharacterized protein LOC126999816 isoform X3 n=1 Tax=Eriocheir sinensis TaxID=95602 RepID=UPI0021C8D7E9|nr:uncharacterized protein LOC126999816 isoform X3 [Eriocheir sinensis]